MIAIKNLLFQPLTFQPAGDQGLHFGPRERRIIDPKQVSTELQAAAQRGLISLEDAAEPPKAAAARKTRSKATTRGKASATSRSRKRGGKKP